MSILAQFEKIVHYFQPPQKTASLAKERLQIIIAHERTQRDKPDYWPALQKDLLEVISKYVSVNKDDVHVQLERKEGCAILELNVTLPQEA